MDRTIEINVRGNYLTKDSKVAGVRGEGNVTNLRITFYEDWDNYAKKITFWNAQGLNPVERILTIDLLESENTRIYLVPIPAEPMEETGMFTFVIEGYLDGKRQRCIPDKLEVKDAPIVAGEPMDPTPTQAEQLQVQIDAITRDIQSAIESKEIAVKAKEGAVKAAEGIMNMSVSAETLRTGEQAFAQKSELEGVLNLHFGLPAGGKGDRGISGVYVGSDTPTDPDYNVWVDPNVTTTDISPQNDGTMGAVLKVKNKYGNWVSITAIKGDKGDKGDGLNYVDSLNNISTEGIYKFENDLYTAKIKYWDTDLAVPFKYTGEGAISPDLDFNYEEVDEVDYGELAPVTSVLLLKYANTLGDGTGATYIFLRADGESFLVFVSGSADIKATYAGDIGFYGDSVVDLSSLIANYGAFGLGQDILGNWAIISKYFVTRELDIEKIVAMAKVVKSKNILKPEELTSGYVSTSGGVSSSTTLAYTKPIPVKEGDIIRIYEHSNNKLLAYNCRFITAYKDGVANSNLGTQYVATYTVPANVDSIVITINPSVVDMITKNYVATELELYFPPKAEIKQEVLPIASENTFGVCKIWTTTNESGEKILNIVTEE